MKDSVEIPLSKSKLFKLLVFSILFVICGLWMLMYQPTTENPIFNNIIIKNTAAFLGTLMGILGIYFFSKKLFDKKPELIINNLGIENNTSALSTEPVIWKDITAIKEHNVQAGLSKQKFIVLIVSNPEEYIAKQQNLLKQKSLRMNLKHSGSPIVISTNTLNIDFNKLMTLLNEKWNEYQNKNL